MEILITVADILEEKVHGRWLSSCPRRSAQEKVGDVKPGRDTGLMMKNKYSVQSLTRCVIVSPTQYHSDNQWHVG